MYLIYCQVNYILIMAMVFVIFTFTNTSKAQALCYKLIDSGSQASVYKILNEEDSYFPIIYFKDKVGILLHQEIDYSEINSFPSSSIFDKFVSTANGNIYGVGRNAELFKQNLTTGKFEKIQLDYELNKVTPNNLVWLEDINAILLQDNFQGGKETNIYVFEGNKVDRIDQKDKSLEIIKDLPYFQVTLLYDINTNFLYLMNRNFEIHKIGSFKLENNDFIDDVFELRNPNRIFIKSYFNRTQATILLSTKEGMAYPAKYSLVNPIYEVRNKGFKKQVTPARGFYSNSLNQFFVYGSQKKGLFKGYSKPALYRLENNILKEIELEQDIKTSYISFYDLPSLQSMIISSEHGLYILRKGQARPELLSWLQDRIDSRGRAIDYSDEQAFLFKTKGSLYIVNLLHNTALKVPNSEHYDFFNSTIIKVKNPIRFFVFTKETIFSFNKDYKFNNYYRNDDTRISHNKRILFIKKLAKREEFIFKANDKLYLFPYNQHHLENCLEGKN